MKLQDMKMADQMTGHEKNKRQIYFEQATMASIKNKFDGKAVIQMSILHSVTQL
jgi:hypothetical protein